jgi:hypothetical protein
LKSSRQRCEGEGVVGRRWWRRRRRKRRREGGRWWLLNWRRRSGVGSGLGGGSRK